MPRISRKKKTYAIGEVLRSYLQDQARLTTVPITYQDLRRYNNTIPLYDKFNKDTLWVTVLYPQQDMDRIYYALKMIYSILKADGDVSVMEHLYVDRVDLCIYGNTRPFRIRIVNRINDNFDYFYIKHADASRVYGLELEHMLSPNRISYLVADQTLIEEHIAGIPGDRFFEDQLHNGTHNLTRLAKEFVKFNERCFVRLLGDMHATNYVIDVTPDFDELHYRIRAIDFDQQSYEGHKTIYMPQYFKQNNPIIQVGLKLMTSESVRQYQIEEHALMATRVRSSRHQVQHLMNAMTHDTLAPAENVAQLKRDLTDFYHSANFSRCRSMGEIVKASLEEVLRMKI
ncbi:hypothetical protein [Tunicatimonas pelagia]|uniref:hypothetical protein n=1 Tax=Tunicatimonas pelagia TaxID=931531 RepID=UPI002665DE71|nr:hypothetical protein [Tunicatimonas pelagia]WKN45722.1 hypothetical protein P0M28_12215 [Tunicatimonas pelagia]